MGQVNADNADNAASAGNAENGMIAITTQMVGRGSQIPERVSRVNGVSGPRMYWAEKRAEPWIAACYKHRRCNTQRALARRWVRLRLRRRGDQGLKKAKSFVGQVGERKGVVKAIGMIANRLRDPLQSFGSLAPQVSCSKLRSCRSLHSQRFILELRPTNYDLQRPNYSS